MELAMPETIYAAFTNAEQAEQAAQALIQQGVRPDHMSLIVHEHEASKPHYAPTEEQLKYNAPQTYIGTDGLLDTPDPLGNSSRLHSSIDGGNISQTDLSPSVLVDKDGSHQFPANNADLAGQVERKEISDHVDTVKQSAGLGFGVGALAAAAALAVPGIGWVLGGGALAVALAGVAASTNSGSMAGGISSFLKDQGVDAEDIAKYQENFNNGGAILAVTLDEDGLPRSEVEQTLRSRGSEHVTRYGFLA